MRDLIVLLSFFLPLSLGYHDIYDHVPRLTFAASSGAVADVESLLRSGADPDKLDWLGQTALHMAAKFQQLESSQALLKQGANHSIRNWEYEETALHLAAKTGSLDIMQTLIDYGADVNADISRDLIPGGTPLLYAALYDSSSSDAIKLLLDHGANVKATNSYGESALHVSVRGQNIRNVQMLIDTYKADIDSEDNDGCTPLNLYAREHHGHINIPMVAFLLDRKADIESRCRRSGRTPLHNAVSTLNLALVDYLLKRGADVNSMDNRGATPLYTAIIDVPPSPHKFNIVRLLLQRGANPNIAINDEDGCRTIMVELAKRGTSEYSIVRMLVAHGAELAANKTVCPFQEPVLVARKHDNHVLSDLMWALVIDTKSALGSTEKYFTASPRFEIPPLIMAASIGNMGEVARILLDPLAKYNNLSKHGNGSKSPAAIVKVQDYLEQTALHVAAINKQLSVARVLLHLGADVNAGDKFGRTALHLAARNGYTPMIELLLNHGAKLEEIATEGTPLAYAVLHSNSHEGVKILLERGARVDAQNHSPTLLHIASTRQNIRMMALLIKYGADVNAKAQVTGLTPLGLLVESDCCYPQLPVVSYLLDHGANVNSRDVNGRTPVNAALALQKRKEVIMYLLGRGADPSSFNIQGCNAPLYRAVSIITKRSQRYYRHSMADSQGKEGDVADIIQELLERGADADRVDACYQETAIDLAMYTGQTKIANMLKKYSKKTSSSTSSTTTTSTTTTTTTAKTTATTKTKTATTSELMATTSLNSTLLETFFVQNNTAV